MNRKISFALTGIMILYTVVVIIISFTSKSGDLTKVWLGYLLYTVVFLLYLFVVSLMELKNLDTRDRWRRIRKFAVIVVISILFAVIGNRIFGSDTEFGRVIFPAVAAAFGLSLIDLAYKKKDDFTV